jgi:NAD(P)H-flavin reductase
MVVTAEPKIKPRPDEMIPAPAKVAEVKTESYDTFTVTLESANRLPLHGFAPGQFNMLYVFGVGELPISISGDAQSEGRLLHTVRSVGKTTQALVSRLPGDFVGVRGPYGTAWPLRAARGKDVLMVAGGIGIAPLRPAIYHIQRNRSEYGRLVVLYGARSPRDLLFRRQLDQWSHVPDTQVLVTVDYGGMSWHGYVGVVTSLFHYVRLQPLHTVAMVCGPEIMMRHVASDLEAKGLPPSDIHISMERNMKCGIGICGHCQYGPMFICRDGPIFPYTKLRPWFNKHEL